MSSTFDLFLIDTLTDRVDVQSILPVKVFTAIDTISNFDGDLHGHRDGDIKCKQTFILTHKEEKWLSRSL